MLVHYPSISEYAQNGHEMASPAEWQRSFRCHISQRWTRTFKSREYASPADSTLVLISAPQSLRRNYDAEAQHTTGYLIIHHTVPGDSYLECLRSVAAAPHPDISINGTNELACRRGSVLDIIHPLRRRQACNWPNIQICLALIYCESPLSHLRQLCFLILKL